MQRTLLPTLRLSLEMTETLTEIERNGLKINLDTLKQIEYLEGFLKSVDKKLSNKSFVDNAPKSVVDIGRKKRDDALIKLENLKKSI